MDIHLLATLVFSLLIGPIVTQVARRYARAESIINILALILVGALTLILILPEAYSDGGWPTLLFVAAGFGLPLILHRVPNMNLGADSVLIVGVLLHVLVESAAVAITPDPEHLGLAVAAHRIPVGLAIFLLASTARTGWLVTLTLVAATIAGFLGGQWMPSVLTSPQEAWLEGFVAGSLFHIIHGHHHANHSHSH